MAMAALTTNDDYEGDYDYDELDDFDDQCESW
jgi:hypothetical protein